jgi:hypothetical protein
MRLRSSGAACPVTPVSSREHTGAGAPSVPLFFHPDCHRRLRSLTGSAPAAVGRGSRAVTAGRELHPAPKRGLGLSVDGRGRQRFGCGQPATSYQLPATSYQLPAEQRDQPTNPLAGSGKRETGNLKLQAARRRLHAACYPVRRSTMNEDPGTVLACSFISEATAEASHSLTKLRRSLVATPIEKETIGNACRSPRRSMTST